MAIHIIRNFPVMALWGLLNRYSNSRDAYVRGGPGIAGIMQPTMPATATSTAIRSMKISKSIL